MQQSRSRFLRHCSNGERPSYSGRGDFAANKINEQEMLSEEALISGYTTPPLSAPAPVATGAQSPASAAAPATPQSSGSSPTLPMPLPAPVTVALPVSTISTRAEPPMTTSEACMYFFLGLTLNFLGLIISILVKRGLTPCMMGFAFSWFFYDMFLMALIGHPVGLMLLTIVFLIVAYYRYHSDCTEKEGNTADFVFYLVLSIPVCVLIFLSFLFVKFFPFSFRLLACSSGSSRIAARVCLVVCPRCAPIHTFFCRILAALGFCIVMCIGTIAGIAVFASLNGMYGRWSWSAMVLGIMLLLVFVSLLTLVIIKIIRGWDSSSMPFLTYLLISAGFGPIGMVLPLEPDVVLIFSCRYFGRHSES